MVTKVNAWAKRVLLLIAPTQPGKISPINLCHLTLVHTNV